MRDRIRPLTEVTRKELIAFTREIIGIPSFCGKEGAVIQRIKQEMETIGYDRVWVDGFGQLHRNMGQGKRLIALDGHCDTVGIGTSPWSHDPFKAGLEDGILYGRGASDQKGDLPAAVYAGRYVTYLRLSGERYSFMIIK